MTQGWVINHRKLKNWEWYKTPNMAHLFQHLIREANHEPRKWQGFMIERGQLATSLLSLKRDTGISIQSIRTCLARLSDTKEISQKSTNKYRVITIANYDTYQKKESQANRQLTDNQQTTNRQLTANNNVNNVNNVNNEKPTTLLVRFDYENRILTGLTDQDYEAWTEAFPAVNIRQEVKSAEQWLGDNPTKRKKQVRRFLTNWLRRAQERGGSRNANCKDDVVARTIAEMKQKGEIE